jgi:hypothetical protein
MAKTVKIRKSLALVDERFIPARERAHDRYAHGMDPDLKLVKLPFLRWNSCLQDRANVILAMNSAVVRFVVAR